MELVAGQPYWLIKSGLPHHYPKLSHDIKCDCLVIGGGISGALTAYLPRKEVLLEKDFKKLFPSISFKREFGWSGVFGKTKDSLPYIGNTRKTPNTFYALGFGGNGITFSLVAAEIITDLLLGKRNEHAEIFSFSR